MIYTRMGFLSLEGEEIPPDESEALEKKKKEMFSTLLKSSEFISSIYGRSSRLDKIIYDLEDKPLFLGVYYVYGEHKEIMVGLTLTDHKYLLSVTTPYEEIMAAGELEKIIDGMVFRLEFSLKEIEYPENETLDEDIDRIYREDVKSK